MTPKVTQSLGGSTSAPDKPCSPARELLERALQAAVQVAFARNTVELEEDTCTEEEAAQDAAWACFGEGTCSEDPIPEIFELLRRFAISDAALAFVKAHEEDYHECLGSTSLDIDVEFMEMGRLVHEAFGCQEPAIARMDAATTDSEATGGGKRWRRTSDADMIEANARLIEALSAYVSLCGNTAYMVDREGLMKAWDLARAALAKARGEA